MNEKVARTVRGFCEAYGVGKSKVYELIAQGKLDVRKVGRRTLIVEESAKAWFNAAAKPSMDVPMYETPLTANESERPRKRQIS